MQAVLDQAAAALRLVDMAPRAVDLREEGLRPAMLSQLAERGLAAICLSVGDDAASVQDAIFAIARERRLSRSGPAIAESPDMLNGAENAPNIILAFCGIGPVNGNLDLVDAYARLGLRLMRLSAGGRNAAVDGHGDGGLTPAGRELVARLNRARILIDLSGTGATAACDAIDASAMPVIFSRGPLPAGTAPDRGPVAELLLACAGRNGVIGASVSESGGTDSLFAQIDALVSLVGPEHVGIGLGAGAGVDIAVLVRRMRDAGYSDGAAAAILGGNWQRVAGEVWK